MRRVLFASTALLALATHARGAQDEIPPDGGSLVRVSLTANREAIRPGEKFILGVELEIEPRWHVYWVNPGDSGIATKVVIEAPAGFEVGNVIFPGPTRHEDEGDIITYVYSGHVMFLVEVKAPPTLEPSARSKFGVDCTWLVCDEICLPGEGRAELTLPTSTSNEPRIASEAKFAAARAAIPKVWTDLKGATMSWSGSLEEPKLQVSIPSHGTPITEVEFFPSKSASTRLSKRAVNPEGLNRRLDLSFEFKPKTEGERPQARGLVMVRTANSVAYYALSSSFDEAAAR